MVRNSGASGDRKHSPKTAFRSAAYQALSRVARSTLAFQFRPSASTRDLGAVRKWQVLYGDGYKRHS